MRFENVRGTEVVITKYGWEFADKKARYEIPFTPTDCHAVRGVICFNLGCECSVCMLMYEKVK